MPAYIVSRVTIEDAQSMADYMARAPETVFAHGGKYLARTGSFEALEGDADYERVVIVEFPDKAAALAWYNSEAYRPLRDQRWAAADAHIILVPDEGAKAPGT